MYVEALVTTVSQQVPYIVPFKRALSGPFKGLIRPFRRAL